MQQLDIKDIISLLPHRYPFILIDKIIDYSVGENIKAIKNVTINEPFFQGHFPQNPVMPGVLQLEAMAQAMAVLAYKTIAETGIKQNTNGIFYFAGVDKARFKKPVYPGDQLLIEVGVIKQKREIWKMEGQITVDGKLACTAELMAAYGE